MKQQHDLSSLNWQLSGWIPHLWRLDQSMEVGASPQADIPAIPAPVPGSVQQALRSAAIIPDWNCGLNYRQCEWVENRHWIYETKIPDEWIEQGKVHRLNFLGLDYCGSIFINSRHAGDFVGSHIPHAFDITSLLQETGNVLRVVFDLPPRWLGQFGFTSKMREWKVRFNYTWDWAFRLVQVGIWDSVYLEVTDGQLISEFRCVTDADIESSTGCLISHGKVSADGCEVRMTVSSAKEMVCQKRIPVEEFNRKGLTLEGFPVELWWPNMEGDQPLYALEFTLLDSNGTELDRIERRVGFKNVNWAPCEDAPEGADPWICVVNGRPIFLQGANWVPILPNFADVKEEDYRKLLTLYHDLGFNILRVWGGGFLERECFYNLCDELGLMVWQEFPLSSSGVDNVPPDDEESIEWLARIAESYVCRRQHHVSLTAWSGGNELFQDGKPLDFSNPVIARFKEIADAYDSVHRFLPTSASGPSEFGDSADFGKGVHWDVHGPWKADGDLSGNWTDYWRHDDALLRSEVGAPGTMSAELIRKYAGDLPVMPANESNPLWRRTSVWWIEWGQFAKEHSREPESLEEYCKWSQDRQKEALRIAVKACKDRFPGCAGVILWMGHDCCPCNTNTAIIDFEGNPKPAALAVSDIFKTHLP